MVGANTTDHGDGISAPFYGAATRTDVALRSFGENLLEALLIVLLRRSLVDPHLLTPRSRASDAIQLDRYVIREGLHLRRDGADTVSVECPSAGSGQPFSRVSSMISASGTSHTARSRSARFLGLDHELANLFTGGATSSRSS
jgi:hypothetical protein